MSTAPAAPKRDLTLADVTQRLEWKGLCAVSTGFLTALGLILGVTIWILQNTYEAKLATSEAKLERKQQEADDLRGRLDAADPAKSTAVAEKDTELRRWKERFRQNDLKNDFLYHCMTYYSAAERRNDR